jgi:transposase
MERKPYRKFSKQFKIEAVRLAEESDKPVTQIARELGVRQNQIYKWKKQLETKGETAFPGTGQSADADGEVIKLRRELAVAKEEIEILKKAAAYFARDIR